MASNFSQICYDFPSGNSGLSDTQKVDTFDKTEEGPYPKLSGHWLSPDEICIIQARG